MYVCIYIYIHIYIYIRIAVYKLYHQSRPGGTGAQGAPPLTSKCINLASRTASAALVLGMLWGHKDA